MGRFKAALGTQDQLAELAGGAFAATGRGDAVGMLANKCRRIGDSGKRNVFVGGPGQIQEAAGDCGANRR